MMSQEASVGVNEAARFLGRSTEQVRRYLREGRLHGNRVGGQWFISSAELESFNRALREPKTFLQQIPIAREADPLRGAIGVGAGGNSNIGRGKAAYREAFRWRRQG
jgi:excisionase family DNA binding protein